MSTLWINANFCEDKSVLYLIYLVFLNKNIKNAIRLYENDWSLLKLLKYFQIKLVFKNYEVIIKINKIVKLLLSCLNWIYAGSAAGTWSLWSACSLYGVQHRRQQCTSCEAGFRLQERFCNPEQPCMYLSTYLIGHVMVTKTITLTVSDHILL